MTGAYAPNPHEGSRSEILADYLFSSWGTVTPVRRQDDYGVDLYCTLSDRIGQRAVVRDYFVVQVKSGTDAWVFEHEESVRWLVDYPTPLFLACVDKKTGSFASTTSRRGSMSGPWADYRIGLSSRQRTLWKEHQPIGQTGRLFRCQLRSFK
jgi:hypothetical protein